MCSIGKTVQEIAEQLKEEAKNKKTPFEKLQEEYQKLKDSHSSTLILLGGEIMRSKAKDKKIAELEAMIEKMKCCANCEYSWQQECSLSPESKNRCLDNKGYSLWELKK